VNATNGTLGDVIVGANERQVRRLADLTDEIEQVGVGKTVNLTLNRGGRQTSVTVNIMDIGPNRP
jgi:2-alkenal reductase